MGDGTHTTHCDVQQCWQGFEKLYGQLFMVGWIIDEGRDSDQVRVILLRNGSYISIQSLSL
jgi:hypothetical protein